MDDRKYLDSFLYMQHGTHLANIIIEAEDRAIFMVSNGNATDSLEYAIRIPVVAQKKH